MDLSHHGVGEDATFRCPITDGFGNGIPDLMQELADLLLLLLLLIAAAAVNVVCAVFENVTGRCWFHCGYPTTRHCIVGCKKRQ